MPGRYKWYINIKSMKNRFGMSNWAISDPVKEFLERRAVQKICLLEINTNINTIALNVGRAQPRNTNWILQGLGWGL